MADTTRIRHLVIGTAGHIDHGKTSLIKALTGRDLDKLDEEKRRGITIELGFAFYGDRIAFVDVPGHERLVKTMIAGASAMSAALVIVAADDGIMPQTREHLSVLRAMGITHGIVAITKADLVEEEWLDLVVEEVQELLAELGWSIDTPVVPVDSISGRGMDDVRTALNALADHPGDRDPADFFRLPVDRSFVIRGHGRVITGSVWNGVARSGDKLRLEPGGQEVRVRGLQAREQAVDEVVAGDRAALNLQTSVEPERGQVLLSPGRGVVTRLFDARLHLDTSARALKHRARIRVHLGTAEVIGRMLLDDRGVMQPGDTRAVRFALEDDLVAMHGDRGVLRFYSPMETLGGIQVIDPDPPDRRSPPRGSRIEGMLIAAVPGDSGDDLLRVFLQSRTILSPAELLAVLPWSREAIDDSLHRLVDRGDAIALHSAAGFAEASAWNAMRTSAQTAIRRFHQDQPNEPGLPAASVGQDVLGVHDTPALLADLVHDLTRDGAIIEEGGMLRDAGFTPSLSPADEAAAHRLHSMLTAHGLNPPVPSALAEEAGLSEARVRQLLKALRNVGRAVILEDKVVISREAYDAARASLRTMDGDFALGDATRLLETSRKVGVPLLERLDKEGFTRRDGDRRTVIG